MTNLIITYSQALAAQGKSLKQAKPLGAVVTDMIIDDEAKGSPLFNETLAYLDDTPDANGVQYNGAGSLNFAKANIVGKWKAVYKDKLTLYGVSDYAVWTHLNAKLKTAGVLLKGKTSPTVKAMLAAPVEGETETEN